MHELYPATRKNAKEKATEAVAFKGGFLCLFTQAQDTAYARGDCSQ